jgi:hypothetical protein
MSIENEFNKTISERLNLSLEDYVGDVGAAFKAEQALLRLHDYWYVEHLHGLGTVGSFIKDEKGGLVAYATHDGSLGLALAMVLAVLRATDRQAT